jgi:hypothetical protein
VVPLSQAVRERGFFGNQNCVVQPKDAAATAARLTTPPPSDAAKRLSGRGDGQEQLSDTGPSVLLPGDGHRQREEPACNTDPATLRQQRRGIYANTVLNEQRTRTDRTTTTSAENCPIHVRFSHLTRPVVNTLQGSEDGRPTTAASRLIGLSTRYSTKRMSSVSARLAHGRQFSSGPMLRSIVREPERGRLRCPGIAMLAACQAAMVRRVRMGAAPTRPRCRLLSVSTVARPPSDSQVGTMTGLPRFATQVGRRHHDERRSASAWCDWWEKAAVGDDERRSFPA